MIPAADNTVHNRPLTARLRADGARLPRAALNSQPGTLRQNVTRSALINAHEADGVEHCQIIHYSGGNCGRIRAGGGVQRLRLYNQGTL